MIKASWWSSEDVVMLYFLANGAPMVDAAKFLNLTQPAVTQRMRRLEEVSNGQIVMIDNDCRRKRILTEHGVKLWEFFRPMAEKMLEFNLLPVIVHKKGKRNGKRHDESSASLEK